MALPKIIPAFTATRGLIDYGSTQLAKSVDRLVKESKALDIVKDELSAMHISSELRKHEQAKAAWYDKRTTAGTVEKSSIKAADALIAAVLNPKSTKKS